MLGQLDAPTLESENVTIENLVKWLVIPWVVVSVLHALGVMKHVPIREAFKPFPEELKRRRRRR